jgi:hypothetical protein
MSSSTTISPELASLLAGVLGLVSIWLGLRRLLSARGSTLGRIEGFRQLVVGLVLVGLATALMWQLRWLALLSLGIGFVEILESSTLIAVWKWGRRSESRRSGFSAWGDSAR